MYATEWTEKEPIDEHYYNALPYFDLVCCAARYRKKDFLYVNIPFRFAGFETIATEKKRVFFFSQETACFTIYKYSGRRENKKNAFLFGTLQDIF